MAAPRLPFLWPSLIRAIEAPAVRTSRTAARARAYQTQPQKQSESRPQGRYGSANQPPPHLGGGKSIGPPKSTVQDAEKKPAPPKIGDKLQKDGEATVEAEKKAVGQKDTPIVSDTPLPEAAQSKSATGTPEATPVADPKSTSPTDKPEDSKPVESLLDTIPDPIQKEPSKEQKTQGSTEHPEACHEEHSPPIRAPHIDPPRYVHHFDTYGLVRHLAEGGWSEQQAVTIMKAVRLKLSENMQVAKEALVSKSMVENETYLFRAACAELKTEVENRRKGEQEKMRTERTHLQHEVDILSQRFGQEAGAMKDELRGMFDDRKMAVRNEQRSMESRLQQINYKITVELQADAKSEVEGLRWVMTRRVIIALFTVVIMVVGSLKVASDAAKEQEHEAKRRSKIKMTSGGTQTEDVGQLAREIMVREGDNPAYVSLG